MSDRPSLRLTDLARMGLIAATLVGSLSLGVGSVAVAQDASPEASPAGECVPGAAIEQAAATAEAEASPVAGEEPAGVPADEAITAAATAFLENAKACIDNPDALATIVTVNLVRTVAGFLAIEEAVEAGFFDELAFAAATVNGVTLYEDGQVGIEVQYMQSEYQVVAEEWWLIMVGDEWKLNAIQNETAVVDGDTAAVGVNLLENEDGTYAITPNAPSVVESEVLILQAISPDTNVEPHELVVLQLPEGADPAGLLDDSIPFEDITFIGVVAGIAPGDSADLTLVGLPVGVYTLVCFFPSAGDPEVPHAGHGMIAPFEVTAPAE